MSDEKRELMQPIGRGVRAYFAPVHREDSTPTVFDPSMYAGFDLDAPPEPWRDLGWIANVKRDSSSQIGCVTAGTKGIAAAQYRSSVEAKIEFDFRDWGKLQMALSANGQHMNVLASTKMGLANGSGGAPVPAVRVLEDSTSTRIVVGAEVQAFAAGDLIAVDVDYQQQTGYVGSGISAAYVKTPMDVMQHPDYVRRVTFNVGRVIEVTEDSLLLQQPLLAGAPSTYAGVQKVLAFADREGGSFFQEWSALFVVPEISGGRMCFYYPRLQSAAPAQETSIDMVHPFSSAALHASFRALPCIDRNDSEQVVCFRTYFPAPGAPVY